MFLLIRIPVMIEESSPKTFHTQAQSAAQTSELVRSQRISWSSLVGPAATLGILGIPEKKKDNL